MTSAIFASDFTSRIIDTARARWSGAALDAIVRTLSGRKAAVTLDAASGHTVVDATLIKVTHLATQAQLLVATEPLDQGVPYDADTLGMILPLQPTHGSTINSDRTKQEALSLFRRHQDAAFRAFTRELGAGREGGVWEVAPGGTLTHWWGVFTPEYRDDPMAWTGHMDLTTGLIQRHPRPSR
ncbi:hypothetical protein [Streptomyces hydrogenans]|uniref:hypothetical protein n=1 Tax=Streptomyces hydrogenans TaxID=1873719 RepID=UPI003815D413